jgi:hypothetical protein
MQRYSTGSICSFAAQKGTGSTWLTAGRVRHPPLRYGQTLRVHSRLSLSVSLGRDCKHLRAAALRQLFSSLTQVVPRFDLAHHRPSAPEYAGERLAVVGYSSSDNPVGACGVLAGVETTRQDCLS